MPHSPSYLGSKRQPRGLSYASSLSQAGAVDLGRSRTTDSSGGRKVKTRTTSLLCLIGLASIIGLRAEKPKLDTILYGASYYHEYMPYERLERDIELMKQADITLIRLGESTWSSWEPEPGRFEFAWMERILDKLDEAGIRVILGTATYSIPPWLFKLHPEILVSHLGDAPPSHAEGYSTYAGTSPPGLYGVRQNMDLTHPAYLFYAERLIRKQVSHFAKHPAIIGFQVDNETHPSGYPAPNTRKLFAKYLKDKFRTTDTLNQIWGLTYWGQLIGDWTELPPIDGILNPGFKLEWERFQRKTVTDFLAWQVDIVREYRRPDQFVLHNFVGGARTDVDQFEIARYLDVAATNPYHRVQDELDGHGIAFSGDVNRSLKNTNYLVTETNAQGIGWDSRGQQPPYDGQLRLNVYSHVSSGANLVAYWHWHSLHYGQETYWKGVLSHDLEPNRAYREVARIAKELKQYGPKLVDLEINNDVAILYSIDSYHGLRFMRFSDRVNYMTILGQMHRALYDMNVGVDFVFSQTEDFSKYKVILVPPLYVADDALLNRLSKFVENGGHILMSFKSGFTNEYNTVRWTKAPGPLREAAGFYYQEFSSLTQQLPLKGDPFGVGEDNQVSVWAEFLIPETAEVVASYDHPFFGQFPAITRNQFGKGTLTYQGTYLSNPLQKAVLKDLLKSASLTGPDQDLPPAVRVKHATSNDGKTVHFYLNYSSESQTVTYSNSSGSDLLSGQAVAQGSNVTIAPWDLLIIFEN
ncbi:MAG: beta-galactosidase [Acidobacteriota bacterium]|nr:MAG: beta-galactosidase [Acidobacteriota bacterium]